MLRSIKKPTGTKKFIFIFYVVPTHSPQIRQENKLKQRSILGRKLVFKTFISPLLETS